MLLIRKTRGGWYLSHNATVTGDVQIGSDASLWFGAVLRGDVARITIGQRTNVQDNAVVHCDTGVPNTIAEDVTIGHSAVVHGRAIGRGSLIGMSATLLSRSVIGVECLIAAGAVVPPDLVVPDRMVVMGVPGKIVRPVKPGELEYMKWLTTHYVEVARKYVDGEIQSVVD